MKIACVIKGHEYSVTFRDAEGVIYFGDCVRCGKFSGRTVKEYVDGGYHNYKRPEKKQLSSE